MQTRYKFEQWKEHLERTYGKGSLVSKKWLEREWARMNQQPQTAVSIDRSKSVKKKVQTSSLDQIQKEIGDCHRCKLCEKRTHIVFGEGNPNARLMFVGEGPGEQEDLQGRPFVGRAGQLLDKIIEAMGLKRSDVFIANVVKCRPPNNRLPEPDEVSACKPFLLKQIEVIKPEIIVALGSTALKCLFRPDVQITKMRGKFTDFNGVKLMPTYHPAYLLRNPPAKKDVWEDMKVVMKELGLSPKA